MLNGIKMNSMICSEKWLTHAMIEVLDVGWQTENVLELELFVFLGWFSTVLLLLLPFLEEKKIMDYIAFLLTFMNISILK